MYGYDVETGTSLELVKVRLIQLIQAIEEAADPEREHPLHSA